MRGDGRTFDALRDVSVERGYLKSPAGSALIRFGDTHVLCSATVDERVPPFLRDSGKGWVTAEYAMLPGSASGGRISRDATKKGRALEISRLIGRSLRSVVDLKSLGERQIIVDCDVIQADGGTRTASITGAYIALYEALQGLVDEGALDAVPMSAQCAAISVGIVGGEVLLDLCYEEDSRADVDLNLVMKDNGDLIEIQGTAEGESFNRRDLDSMVDLGTAGIERLCALQREVLNLA